MSDLDLSPDSRSFKLREMFWNDDYRQYTSDRQLSGSEAQSQVDRARNFEILLEAMPPVIQPFDLLAGIPSAHQIRGGSLDLGHYDGHYTPGHANLIDKGLTGIRDRAREKLLDETDPERRDFLESTVIAYDAAIDFAARHADHADRLAADTEDPRCLDELRRIARACRRLDKPAEARAAIQQAKAALGRMNSDAPFTETTNYDQKEWSELLAQLSAS